jgi:streptogramin lyase
MKKIHFRSLPVVAVSIVSIFSTGAAFADNVYISNNGSNSIAEIIDGNESTFISGGPGLSAPTGVAIYGSNLFVANNNTGDIGEFSLANGNFEGNYAIGMANPRGIVFDSAGDLFVANQSQGTITLIAAGSPLGSTGSTFASGLTTPNGLAIYDGSLYVADGSPGNTIDEISLSTRHVINPFIGGLNKPNGLAVEGSSIYEVNKGSSQVLDFNAITGGSEGVAVTDAANMLGSNGLAIDSIGDFYVTDEGDNSVTEYNPAGHLIAVFNSGFTGPNYIATDLAAVPEPSTYALLVAGLGALFVICRRKKAMV